MELKEVWLIDYARTAFSRSRPRQPERDVFGEIRSDVLLGTLINKFFEQKLLDKGIEKKDLDEVTVGTAMGVYENWTYGGRLPCFIAEMPAEVPALFVDRQCGSAGSGLHVGIMEIMTGFSKICMATGVEHMTRVSMQNDWVRPNLDMVNKRSPYYRPQYDLLTTINMIQTAQKLYEEEMPAFTKEDLDNFGVRSHNLTVKYTEEGWFKGEIIPIEGHIEGNIEEPMMVDRDMAARKSTLEGVAGLRRLSKAFFLEKNGGKAGYKEREGTTEGVITAGNSSPLNAGATACVVMDAKEAEDRGIKPMARIVSLGWAGVDPSVMGRGPVPATEMALKYAGLSADDMDYWEINEAFTMVTLNCMKAFNIAEEKVNVMGGATAIGHPLGSTMVRLPGTLARILKDKKAKYGCANACCGGGQGVAVILENPEA